MQLWLKSIAGVSEYAMNKPPEEEIWPNTRPVEFDLWPSLLPGGMDNPMGDYDLVWDLERLEGAQMKMKLEGRQKDYLDRVALMWRVIETHRTHCPRCWEKMKGSPYFLGADFGGHEAFTCPANSEFDDRFPREE